MSALYDFGYRWGWRIGAWFCRKVLRVDIDDAKQAGAGEDDELICFHGGPPGTRMTITDSSWGPIRCVHVPDDEIVLPPDAPVWRIEPHDHGGPHE
jgi:hypothetical protein